ncbi:SRPBCC family protein [Phyllobacterium zundukense]|uniref:Activator of Hsp90 ATPase homologue 1/2-like C-terminal domain-containing protein n=1 Tax=Phyllobacterium zundukense TaxID=1867719 RepID=A0A2N9VR29_9HYPH|nr:SRPBCC family protein [Phyllobacterium zundukense]ATU92379.1 hypothetical protein BLM14_12620 [Phyllobacterium zundukense]PIO41947.1 hypothetical protein B5P45_23070 [Phyllobacterium zundukense]
MTERSVQHSTIVIERTYDASPARVFYAWSDKDALLRWINPGGTWDMAYDHFEFRVGGQDISRFGRRGGETYTNRTYYQDIVQDERIVSAGTMDRDGTRIFSGLTTVEFKPSGKGCRMVMTEQGVFLDGGDVPENHQAGWDSMLDSLGNELQRENV